MRTLRPSSRAALAVLTSLFAVPLSPLAAGAEEALPHEQVVDITFPTDPRATYTNDYDSPRSRGSHGATDLIGEKGWGVHAAVGGTVTWAPGSDGSAMPSYGYMVRIKGTDGRKYSYVHLNNDTPGTDDGEGGAEHAYAPGIVEGAEVTRGQLIGYLGDSGNAESSSPHLHFEIEDATVTDPDGTNRINPYFSLKDAEARDDYPVMNSAAAPVGARSVDDSCPDGEVPAHGFHDVEKGSTHDAAIACAVWWNVARGVGGDHFAPGRDVTRAQMASFMARLVVEGGGTLPAEPADHFTDDDGSTHERSINQLAAAGIVGGIGGGRFAPEHLVTRGQMATFLVRAYEHAAAITLPDAADAFSDDDGDTHEARIDQAAAAGFAAGVETDRYAPARNVSRGQVTSFLVRVLDLLVEDGHATTP